MSQTKPRRNTYVVWEITLKCNLACSHCGSRAGDARQDELTTEEALDLVHQMADAGVTEVTLIGGEAYLRKDWLEIAKTITDRGMICSMTTGGYGITRELAERMKRAGISQVSISVDGLEQSHNQLRGKDDSWRFCFQAMEHFKAVGIPFGNNTQINRHTAKELPKLYQLLRDAGSRSWQIQLTVPMGNATENADLLLQPHELLDLYPMLSYLSDRGRREGLILQPGNNIGYYGPYETQLRGWGNASQNRVWQGCQAGISTLGIEADGAIKGCPSLPTYDYTGGNIREQSLVDIVQNSQPLNINMNARNPQAVDHLWGFCQSCDYARACRGGCNWTAHVFFNKRGNNPYCHHRALVHAAKGQQEAVHLVSGAPGLPFDNGVFGIEISDIIQDEKNVLFRENRFSLNTVLWPDQWLQENPTLVSTLKEEKRQSIQLYQEKSQVKERKRAKITSDAKGLFKTIKKLFETSP